MRYLSVLLAIAVLTVTTLVLVTSGPDTLIAAQSVSPTMPATVS